MNRPAFVFTSIALLSAAGAMNAPAAEAKPPRAARSVHLGYPGPDGVQFYNEVVVEESVPGSYFMACGWNTGYFGIQQIGAETNKVVIFSVWDPAKGNNPNAVPAEQRVEVLYEGEGVKVTRFGGEGTGGKSMFKHVWKIGETNRFLLHAAVEGEKTAYTAYYFLNEGQEWKKLATFRTTTKGSMLKGYYSFIEDFRRDGKSVQQARRARFGNGWVQNPAGEWVPLTRARFTASGAEWEAKESINAGVVGNEFFLVTGGETKNTLALRSTIERRDGGKAPEKLPTLKAAR